MISFEIGWLDFWSNALWTAGGMILALHSLALVDLLLKPSLDGFSAVSRVTAHG